MKKNTLYTWLKVKVRLFFQKGLVMVSQVGLNTSVSSALPALYSNNTGLNQNASLFSNYNPMSTNNYSDDIFMSNMDFSQFAGGVSQNPQQASGQISFQGNPAAENPQDSEPKKSNTFKILGAITGAVAPLVPKVIDLFKGGSFTKLFKSKALLSSCGIFGVVGLGAGMLLDSCFSSRKAQSPEQSSPAASQQQQEIIRNFVNQQTVK